MSHHPETEVSSTTAAQLKFMDTRHNDLLGIKERDPAAYPYPLPESRILNRDDRYETGSPGWLTASERKPYQDNRDKQPNTESAGGSRYSTGKPRMIYAPWLGMLEVCRVAEMGADKYAPFDYQNGQSFSTLLNCMMRHIVGYTDAKGVFHQGCLQNPLARDEESGYLHAGHAAWNLMTLLMFIEQGRADELDDVTIWHGITAAQKRELLKDLGTLQEVEAYLKKRHTVETLSAP